MLQDGGAELAHELAVLVVDLDLVRGRPLRHDDVPALSHHRHPVRVEELPVALAALAELELEPPLAVEDLDAVVVGVGHDDVVLRVDRHARGLRELALEDAELAELAVVDHLLALDLGLWRVHHGRGGGGRGAAAAVAVVVRRAAVVVAAAAAAVVAAVAVGRVKQLGGEVEEGGGRVVVVAQTVKGGGVRGTGGIMMAVGTGKKRS